MLSKFYWLLLIVLAFTFKPFLGDNALNMLLIGVIATTPILYLIGKDEIEARDPVDGYFFTYLLILTFSCFINISHFRITSYIYTVCLVTCFLCIKNALYAGYYSRENIIEFLRFVIYAYFGVLVLQQICILIGISPILACTDQSGDFRWKLPSLAPEASHVPRFMMWTIYAYICLAESEQGCRYTMEDAKNDRKLWLCYFWVMLSIFSTTAIMLAFVPLTKFIKKETIFRLLPIIICIILFLPIIMEGNGAYERVLNLLPALASVNAETIVAADQSGANRILPFFSFWESFNLLAISSWLGHGLDYGREFIGNHMYNLSNDVTYRDGGADIGGMFGYIMDFGLITFYFLCRALKSIVININDNFMLLVWVILSLVSGVNMQMFWYSLTMLLFVSYYSQEKQC